AANAEVARLADVLEGVNQLVRPTVLQTDHLACRGYRLGAGLERRSGADKQADFNPLAGAYARHLANFIFGQQHDAASLADAMDRHLEFLRGLQHFTKDARALDAGDLEAVISTILEPLAAGLERVVVFAWETEFSQELLGSLHERLL